MKVSAINTISNVNFQGDKSKKASSVKNAAGAAMIAIAAAVPAEEAQGQYYVPIPPPAYYQYYVPVPVMNVPKCFIFGDANNENYEKTMPDVFREIDREIEENGQISVNEVVSLEEYNHNSNNAYPMTRGEKVQIANLVKNLSRKYNQSNSNPNTINYSEYKNIMKDYMRSKNAADFMNLIQIWTNTFNYNPYYHHHHCQPVPPPPPHHHHHRHW